MKFLIAIVLVLLSACTATPPRVAPPSDPLVPLLAYYHRHGIDLEFEATNASSSIGTTPGIVRTQYQVATPGPVQTIVTIYWATSRARLDAELIRLPIRSTLHPHANLALVVWSRPHPTIPGPPTPAQESSAAALRQDIESLFVSYAPPR